MTDLSKVDLNLLVAFDVLLDECSVRGAARRLHVTPSAMSHTLRRLRDLLGDDLLVRAGRGMVATPRAETLVEPVRALLVHARQVLTDPDPFSAARLRRAFRIACTDHISTVLLPHVERILADEAPGVDLYVCPPMTEGMHPLRVGAVDVAVGVFTAVPPEVHSHTLFGDRFVTVARVGHPRVRGPALTLETFLAEQHVLVAPTGSPVGPIDELLAARGLHRRVARTRPSFLAALWLVAGSDLVLTASRRIVRATLERLPVAEWPTPLPVTDYALTMAWHPRVEGDAEQGWFRDVLVRAARGV